MTWQDNEMWDIYNQALKDAEAKAGRSLDNDMSKTDLKQVYDLEDRYTDYKQEESDIWDSWEVRVDNCEEGAEDMRNEELDDLYRDTVATLADEIINYNKDEE